jgi:hypothetical protein
MSRASIDFLRVIPVSGDRNAKPYEIFDGQKLVSIRDYLKAYPRPDRVNSVNDYSEEKRPTQIVSLSRNRPSTLIKDQLEKKYRGLDSCEAALTPVCGYFSSGTYIFFFTASAAS